ncbi:MAG: hypothetical protein WCJ35_26355, partial [Planctomycetota bacterium]
LIPRDYKPSAKCVPGIAGELVLAAKSGLEDGAIVTSTVVPLSFQLLPAQPRPQIRITEIGGQRRWSA